MMLDTMHSHIRWAPSIQVHLLGGNNDFRRHAMSRSINIHSYVFSAHNSSGDSCKNSEHCFLLSPIPFFFSTVYVYFRDIHSIYFYSLPHYCIVRRVANFSFAACHCDYARLISIKKYICVRSENTETPKRTEKKQQQNKWKASTI